MTQHRHDDYKNARKGPFGMRLKPKTKRTRTVTKTAEENAASVVGVVNAIHAAQRIPFLTINIEGQLELHQDRTFTVITSKEQLAKLVGIEQFQVSSSIDFPEDHTKDQNVIDIVNWVKG